jgi:hypothetical protein
MKFRDIPQFTRSGSWECDFDFKYFADEINKMVNEQGLQLNPDFQRGHVWTEEQQRKYVEFLLRGGKTARVIYLNNPHWNSDESEYKDFVCVDGLQRTTAIIAFINNDIKVFDTYFKDFEDNPRMIQNTIRININDLQTKKEVLQWYLEFNSGGTVHTDAELNKVRQLLKQETKINTVYTNGLCVCCGKDTGRDNLKVCNECASEFKF